MNSEMLNFSMFQDNLIQDETFQTDFKIICENTEFLVHKEILSASSSYFKEWFKQHSHISRLQLNFLNSKTFDIVLKYIYEGQVDLTNESLSSLLDLMTASRTFQILFLYSHCLQLIKESLSPEILLSEWCAIVELNNDEFKQAYLTHFHVQNLNKSRSFVNLTEKQIHSLLSSLKIKLTDHEVILSAILYWVNYDKRIRKGSLNRLLQTLDFGQFSKAQLREFSKNPLLHWNLYFNQQIAGALLQEELQETVSKPFINPEESKSPSKRLICYNKNTFRTVVEYNNNSKTWMDTNDHVLMQAIFTAKFSAICNFDHYIYFFGGIATDGSAMKECKVLDLWKNQVFEILPMKESRIDAKAIKINDFIYIFGGHPSKNQNISITNERYNLRTQLWDTIPTLSCQEHNPAHILITSVNDSVCLVGKDNLFWFDPQKNEWGKGESFPITSPSTADSVIHYDNKIFLMKFLRNAAQLDLKIVCLDLITNIWNTFAVTAAEFTDIIDLASIFEADKFLLNHWKKFYLFTPPESLYRLYLYPFKNPGLMVIEKSI